MATDFRDGRTFPRPGRQKYGDALWFLRVQDKARASAAGTIHDYIYPCPMDQGVMERWGITPAEWDDAIAQYRDDASLYGWLTKHVSPDKMEVANRWLLAEKVENLDRQDSEEGVTTHA